MTPEPLVEAERELAANPFGSTDPAATVTRWDSALERLAARPRVSVVIPIYNAVAALDACLESLVATDTRAQVVLVDDCSTDSRIGDACARFAERWEDAVIVRVPQNRGFVSSVNSGIQASDPDRDVVLLNSDTRVTTGWLEKLQTVAHLDADVATVSPLSNAAGIFSLPAVHRANALPEGWEPEHCNRLLEAISPRIAEELPTSSGFCMYIRRAAIDAVGVFDALLLHRGYGEENDFCSRTGAAGFINLVDDATFIFHEREASFAGSKAALKRRNSRVLKAMHPTHIRDQLAWEERTTLGALRAAYAATLDRLLALRPETARAALAPERTRLVVATQDATAPLAATSAGERVAVLRLGAGRSELDLPAAGRARLPVTDASPAGLVAWIANRLGARSLDVVAGALEAPLHARVRAAVPLLDESNAIGVPSP